jgi:hypothetical protein
MNVVSVASDKPWITSPAEVPMALEIVLLKRTVVLSWSQFVYAERTDDEVRIAFASHDVLLKGAGLFPLLADISAQRVRAIYEPVRSDRFSGAAGRFIREITVARVDVHD